MNHRRNNKNCVKNIKTYPVHSFLLGWTFEISALQRQRAALRRNGISTLLLLGGLRLLFIPPQRSSAVGLTTLWSFFMFISISETKKMETDRSRMKLLRSRDGNSQKLGRLRGDASGAVVKAGPAPK